MSEKTLAQLIEEAIDSKDIQLPVFNPVAGQVHRMISSGDYQASDLTELIEKDPALSAKILNISNSAFYAGLQPVRTIQNAIVRLGASTVSNVVLTATQETLYKARLKPIRERLDRLWVHALGTAIGGKWLARRMGFSNLAEEAYMAGLLHDIGKLALLRTFDELIVKKKTEQPLSMNLIEDILENMHSAIGKRFLDAQNIPEMYGEIAARHHEGTVAGNEALLNLIRLADKTCHKLGLGRDPMPELVLSTLPEAITLMAKDLVLAELQVHLEDWVEDLNASL